MSREDRERAAMRKRGLVPIAFSRQQRPCQGPDEPACIQALCVGCGSFSTASSLTTPMQPPARFIRGEGWQCVEFHEANVGDVVETRKTVERGGEVASSSTRTGLGAAAHGQAA